jgi:hypothetical protein
MGHDGLTSRESINRVPDAARLVWEAIKEKVAVGTGEWKTRMQGFVASVSVMVLLVVGLPVLVLIACVVAQLPPGEKWE